MPPSVIEVPSHYQSLDNYLKTNPQLVGQERQLQIRLFESSKSSYKEFLGIFYSSEAVKRMVIPPKGDEARQVEVLSHIPSNVMICPFKKLDEHGDTIETCTTEVDMLPYTVDMNDPPKTICPVHKIELKWKDWNPPLSEIGFKTTTDMVMSYMSEAISNTILPKEFKVVENALDFSEGILEMIYSNDDWVNNDLAFMNEGFDYTLQNTIMTNVESAMYKSKAGLIKNQMETYGSPGNQPQNQGEKQLGPVAALRAHFRV